MTKMKLWAIYKYNQLKELPNFVDGIVIDFDRNDYLDNPLYTSYLDNSVLMVGELFDSYWIKKYPKIKTFYVDESIVNNRYKDHEPLRSIPNVVFGEPDKSYLLKYKDDACQVTYTAYREYIKIFGLRIPLWWTNQIKVWEWMEKQFGNRFNVCWISIDKNDGNYEELIIWAKEHNKQIWLYIENNITVTQLITQLSKLIEE